jgi:hypothetical protein
MLACREELLAVKERPACQKLPTGLEADDLRWVFREGLR